MSDICKWIYSFALLGATIYWAKFCVDTILAAMSQPTPGDVIATAGVSGLLGALITLDTLVAQHWFRKKTPE